MDRVLCVEGKTCAASGAMAVNEGTKAGLYNFMKTLICYVEKSVAWHTS